MDDKALTLFLALADNLHFGRAAESCHLSPSALSRAIQALETELGAQLFQRDNRHVSLTREGRVFQEQAQQLLKQWQQAKAAVSQEVLGLTGELKIFCSVTASYSFLYEILHDFRKRQPNIDIKLNTGDPAQGIHRVRDETEDIAIAAMPERLPRGVDFRRIQTTPLLLIANRESADLYHRNTRRFWQQTPMIVSMEGPARDKTEAWLTRSKLKPRIYAQVAGNEAIVSMVALGFGAGVVPEIVLENSPLKDRVIALPQSTAVGHFEIGLFALRKRLQDPIVNGFWQSQ
ncbi:HTH-type transcriptional activator IlvY [Halioxenophilus sp. WMMB6]|uniref:HTH-type transcriptional activator IlvY n=1 Tax=Halioxenophilus sp. WMMB6 TaxID=3073815 RepID=UPI00295EED8E|nr:HTH-type transcriptional activator IlvY [Halioxenophilus sp. WMMB6]